MRIKTLGAVALITMGLAGCHYHGYGPGPVLGGAAVGAAAGAIGGAIVGRPGVGAAVGAASGAFLGAVSRPRGYYGGYRHSYGGYYGRPRYRHRGYYHY